MTNVNPLLTEKFAANFEMVLQLKNQEKRFNFIETEYKGWNLFLLTMGNKKLFPKTLEEKFKSISKIIVK